MYFQFSPPPKQVPAKVVSLNEFEETPILSLAPFSPIPKIFFNNVTVGTTEVQLLIIKNPLDKDVELTVDQNFPEEITVDLNWCQKIIEKNSEITLQLSWTPKLEGAWRHMFHLTDRRKVRRDIPIVFKSVTGKKNKTIRSKTNTQRLPKFKTKSPIRSFIKKKSPVKRIALPNITNVPKIIIESPSQGNFPQFVGKENYDNIFISGLINNFDLETETQIRRNTYTVNSLVAMNHDVSSNSDSVFDDSLEINLSLKEKSVENDQKSIISKLQSASFMFSPVISQCGNETSFNNTSTPHCKQTFPEQNKTFDLLPKSEDNSLRESISGETFVKDNLSSETYVKGNVSSSTYVKDSSLNDIATLQLSPIQLKISEGQCVKSTTHTFDTFEKRNKPLDSIKEESYFYDRSQCSSFKKRKSDVTYNVTPHKRVALFTDWSKERRSFRISKKTTGLNGIGKSEDDKKKVGVATTNTKEMIIKDPFLLAAVDSVDPFMTSIYFSEEWMDQQERNFKKWLNALLTPPKELDSVEEHPLDVAKLWTECKNKEVAAAPTREMISEQYHTNKKLNFLRKVAMALFRLEEIKTVLSKVIQAVDSNRLSIRQDRNIHLDLALQSEIMSIILSYNPLWLRIGLETIYNEIIPMRSNSDLTGLTSFIQGRFFRDPYLLKKHKTVHSPKYKNEIKKCILKKFLVLVYVLDQAKTRKLIQHDPCLFCKNGPIKESREVLLTFARETISAVGDITKYLKYFGYIVTHKQTYIDEFNYAVNYLGADLRDGVRLAKVMEIILLRGDISRNLRVPAISKLQKIHNVKVVFDSLEDAGFKIVGDISPRDIVNGHKEKTLSFLWQIIHKFQAPLMVKCATTIQNWWRSSPVLRKRRSLRAVHMRKEEAARKIQLWYSTRKLADKLEEFVELAKLYKERIRLDKAAIKIQSFVKMYLIRKKFLKLRNTIIGIQRCARKWLGNGHRKQYLAAIRIQSCVRMFIARMRFQKLKYCVLFVEERYLANKLMKIERERFENLKYATLQIQYTFRANKICKQIRSEFLELKASAIIIQQHFRATIAMREERNRFLELKWAVLIIQQQFRAKMIMKRQRERFQMLRKATITIQRRFRANIIARIERDRFTQVQNAVIIVQKRFRASIMMKNQRKEFCTLKKAAIVIQRRYRAIIIGRLERDGFTQLKRAVVIIQQWFRATMIMKKERNEFQTMRKGATVIQRRFRAKTVGRVDRDYFIQLKLRVVTIQQRFRATMIMKRYREEFRMLRKTTIMIQKRFRAKIIGRIERDRFTQVQNAVIIIQKRFRASIMMKNQRKEFCTLKRAAIVIQRRYRAIIIGRLERDGFIRLKRAVVIIQQWFRATIIMKKERNEFQTRRKAAIVIQRCFRAKTVGKVERDHFIRLKLTVVTIQQRFRATMIMRRCREEFHVLKKATIIIQKRFRAKVIGRIERDRFTQLQKAAITIQKRFRANSMLKKQRDEFQLLRKATIIIQRHFRAKLIARIERNHFIQLQKAVITIQQWFRAAMVIKIQREEYQTLRKVTIMIQRRFRARVIGRIQRDRFIQLQKAVITTQQRFRAKFMMKIQREEFQMLRKATIIIQRRFRAKVIRRIERDRFIQLQKAVVTIQQRFRTNIMMKKQREEFQRLRNATIVIQRGFRATIIGRIERDRFTQLQKATRIIQQRFRANIMMKKQRGEFQRLRKAAIVIQRLYRPILLMRKQEEAEARRIIKLQNQAAAKIQAAWRGHKSRSIEDSKLSKIRERSRKANESAVAQNTLGSRCEHAVRLISDGNFTLLEIIRALKDLEYITRRCKTTCLEMSSLLSTSFYLTIAAANRSPSEMEAGTIATHILINFWRYPASRGHSWVPHHIDKLITTMLHCCDKEHPLFPSICTLIWFFSHDEECKRTILQTPNFDQKITKIEALCNRKQKMNSKMKINFDSLFFVKQNLPLPSLVPDWGFEQKSKPKVFLNSLQALQNLLKMFKN